MYAKKKNRTGEKIPDQLIRASNSSAENTEHSLMSLCLAPVTKVPWALGAHWPTPKCGILKRISSTRKHSSVNTFHLTKNGPVFYSVSSVPSSSCGISGTNRSKVGEVDFNQSLKDFLIDLGDSVVNERGIDGNQARTRNAAMRVASCTKTSAKGTC